MKHPSIKVLQDYFENEAESKTVDSLSNHIKNCNKCSLILSEIAKLDIIFAKSEVKDVPLDLKEKTMSKANLVLKRRRELLKEKSLKAQTKQSRRERVSAFVDLKMPALQASALLLFIVVFTEVSRTEVITINEKVINNEFKVFYSDLEGEINEDN